MPDNNTPNEFDIAAIKAENELLQLFNQLNDEQKKGAMTICRWHTENYHKAGHKRLGRIMVKLANCMQNSQEQRLPPEFVLTNRELEVLKVAQSGLHIKEIADSLELGHGTTRNHLSSIYSKLEVRNRQEAIVKAIELGLLKPI